MAPSAAGAHPFAGRPTGAVDRSERDGERVTALGRSSRATVSARASGRALQPVDQVVRRLAAVVEAREPGAIGHMERIGCYCALLAERAGLEPARCEQIGLASRLHDIGKIGIPDAILQKPGPLSVDERKVMEAHVQIGYRLLAGWGDEVLELAAVIALTHHEWYGDGVSEHGLGGYPRALAGHAIPIEGRIVAVADVFDALISERVYSRAYPAASALRLIEAGRGSQFDPDIVDALLDTHRDMLRTRSRQARAMSGAHTFTAGIRRVPLRR